MAIMLVVGILMIGGIISLVQNNIKDNKYAKYKVCCDLRDEAHDKGNKNAEKYYEDLAKKWKRAYEDSPLWY